MPPVVALEGIRVQFGTRAVLDGVTLGIERGQRVGVVGRNGDGKSTLLRVLAGLHEPDDGRVARARDLRVVMVGQGDALPPGATTVRDVTVGDRAPHEWAADPRIRAVLGGLLGGVAAQGLSQGLDTALAGLSGGERRRVALAAALMDPGDLLLLDEPTNHLDLEAVAWLAGHLTGPTGPACLVVVTHDRWFLDEVCTATWEVADGQVHRHEGGYAAFVLARAERERRAALTEARRRSLVRKELAWLRRGPPARTSKPQFRIDAANALIADVPEPRDRLSLRRLATARLGRRVVDLEGVAARVPTPGPGPGRTLLGQLTWQLGPGDRVGLLGPNGVGKTTLLRILTGAREPDAGEVTIGATVVPAVLEQVITVPNPQDRVLDSVERLRREVEVGGGTVSVGSLLEDFGFRGQRLATRIGDLSGGELRRLVLLTLLIGSPNLLVLDEPTNDLDIETLTVVEDLLDTWPGTLVVVSHDRYFLERTCDDVYAMLGDGGLRHLPRGVEEYLELRAAGPDRPADPPRPPAAPADRAADGPATRDVPATSGAPAGPSATGPTAAQARAARKELTRLESRLSRITVERADLHARMAQAHADHLVLAQLAAAEGDLAREQDTLEERWLELAATLEG